MKKFLLAAPLAIACVAAHGQAVSVNGGAIQGTITDASGAAISGANITVKSIGQGTTRDLTTDKSGFYSVGPLNPGQYLVTVSAPGFQNLEVTTRILTGTATPGSFKLQVGQSSETVEVKAGDLQVNTDQAGVSDVITREQIQNLPVNGRNFMDLAQIEPGVILQQGTTFDPTKAGYSAISISGVSGRTTRILLDGQDITDETVGATILNVSQGAINEFQLNRSTQEVSGELGSSGLVLVSTNSGTNSLHGQVFYNFQDFRAGFANTSFTAGNPYFQRNQFGASVGGPIIKDKLFFFANYERILQKQFAATNISTTLFPALAARYTTVGTPYKNNYSTARFDWNGPLGGHYFTRLSYQVDGSTTNRGLGYWLFNNRDNTPAIAFGADFAHGRLTHSFRGSYEKFHNFMADATQFGSASQYYPYQGVAVYNSAGNLYGGPNYLAPQVTFQSDKQVRYDGTWTKGSHNVKFGASFNRVLGGGFASFYGFGPRIATTSATRLTGGNCPANGAAFTSLAVDPFSCYSPSSVRVGNGVGYATSDPNFGFPGGGLYSYRFGAYVADSWKVTPHFTLSAGVRYSLDTNRQGQNIAPPLCSEITDPRITGVCSGNTTILSLVNPKFTGPVRQPKSNFGPQLGITYAPGNQKTVLRAGIGVYFETAVFNQLTNANTYQRKGLILNTQALCGGNNTYTIPVSGGNTQAFTTSPNGTDIGTLCGQAISQSYSQFIAIENNIKSATLNVGPSANAGFIAQTLVAGGAFAPDYKTPYAIQFNAGIQRELFKGAVLSADYVHNGTQRIGQAIDLNHNGAARTLNTTAAAAAIARRATLLGGGGPGTSDLAYVISRGGTLAQLSASGLDSGNVYNSGSPAALRNRTAATGAAFPGLNTNLGTMSLIEPIGRSGYDALQVVFREQKERPLPGIQSASMQISYSLSRNITNSTGGSDQFFSSGPYDYDQTNRYMGRNGLDHFHSVNLGGNMTFRYGPRLGVIGHFYSAPPLTMQLDQLSGTAGAIFQTDFTGDGTTSDIVPGSNPGSYMHGVNSKNFAQFVNNYNSQYAGKPTPAGQALINAGLATQSQLYALGAVLPTIAAPANGRPILNPAFRTFDANFSYPIRLGHYFHGMGEAIALEPAVAMYNVFNMANYGTVSGTLVASAYGGVASTHATGTNANNYLNGPSTADIQYNNRSQRAVGSTFSQGAPRTTEFQLKLTF